MNLIATKKYEEKLYKFESVEVTIYLGRGTHFFFSCFSSYGADIGIINGSDNKVTDFCSEIDSLRPAYLKSDNMKLTVKPLDCADNDYSDSILRTKYQVACTNFNAL